MDPGNYSTTHSREVEPATLRQDSKSNQSSDTEDEDEDEVRFYGLKSVTSAADASEAHGSTESLELGISFDCVSNLEACLEEFSCLARKGKFNTARGLFDSCPRNLKTHPEFILDFVDTLLRQGTYDSLMELEPTSLMQLSGFGIHPTQYVQSVFDLGKHKAFGYFKILEDMQFSGVWSELLSNFEQLNSMQLQLLCNFIQLSSEMDRYMETPNYNTIESEKMMGTSLNWFGLYEHLLKTNRIWDMRDLFHALCSRYGVGDTIKLLFTEKSQIIPSKSGKLNDFEFRGWFNFVFDWAPPSYSDESTDLALLDVLVTISLQLLPHGGENNQIIKEITSQAMSHANQFAISLSLRNSENVQTSPYLRWVLAHQRLARELPADFSQGPNYEYLKKSKGIVVWTCNLPIYIPPDVINGGGHLSWETQTRRTHENLLKMGLNTSSTNEDYSLGVQYLEEMFYTSDSPLEVLTELSHLQKDVQGSKIGYLRTCLTKYLCTVEKPAMEALNIELREFDEKNDMTESPIDPITRWCQRGIQSALCCHLDNKPQARSYLEMQLEIYETLPNEFKRLLAEIDIRDSTNQLSHTDHAHPELLSERGKTTIYRDGNFIICDSTGYFTRLPPTTNIGDAVNDSHS